MPLPTELPTALFPHQNVKEPAFVPQSRTSARQALAHRAGILAEEGKIISSSLPINNCGRNAGEFGLPFQGKISFWRQLPWASRARVAHGYYGSGLRPDTIWFVPGGTLLFFASCTQH
jgi:hypothetical protein